jgi:hypothetical protein
MTVNCSCRYIRAYIHTYIYTYIYHRCMTESPGPIHTYVHTYIHISQVHDSELLGPICADDFFKTLLVPKKEKNSNGSRYVCVCVCVCTYVGGGGRKAKNTYIYTYIHAVCVTNAGYERVYHVHMYVNNKAKHRKIYVCVDAYMCVYVSIYPYTHTQIHTAHVRVSLRGERLPPCVWHHASSIAYTCTHTHTYIHTYIQCT